MTGVKIGPVSGGCIGMGEEVVFLSQGHFKDINDTEIPITFSKKIILKNQCLAIYCIWG